MVFARRFSGGAVEQPKAFDSEGAGSMQRPCSSQTWGNAQSATVLHASGHAPGRQRYGAQIDSVPLGERSVTASLQTGPSRHLHVGRSQPSPR